VCVCVCLYVCALSSLNKFLSAQKLRLKAIYENFTCKIKYLPILHLWRNVLLKDFSFLSYRKN